MPVITLKRVAGNEDGTFGVLIKDNIPFALTVEPEWKNNKRNISCIPAGEYRCERISTAKFGETFVLINVLNRSGILFHKGNVEADTKGCILVGEQFEHIKGKTAIWKTGKGFGEFMGKLKGRDSFDLVIIDAI